MLGRTPKTLSRASSIMSVETVGRDFVELISDEPNTVDQVTMRRRTMSLGSKGAPRARTTSLGACSPATSVQQSKESLRRKTLNASLQAKVSRDESMKNNTSSEI